VNHAKEREREKRERNFLQNVEKGVVFNIIIFTSSFKPTFMAAHCHERARVCDMCVCVNVEFCEKEEKEKKNGNVKKSAFHLPWN
jgi:hypothetical protein